MQYRVKGRTLIIEGDFEAASTGLNGGCAQVNYLFNKQVPRTFNHPSPQELIKKEALKLGIKKTYFGLFNSICYCWGEQLFGIQSKGRDHKHNPGFKGKIIRDISPRRNNYSNRS